MATRLLLILVVLMLVPWSQSTACVPIGESPAGRPGWIERMYPNPTSSVLRLEVKSMGVPSRVEVFNVLGRRVFRRDNPTLPFGTNVVDVDLHNLPSGTYYLEYRDARGGLARARKRITVLR